MTKYRFCITRYTWSPRMKRTEKWLTVPAASQDDAYQHIYDNYRGWEINCFWPIWPQ